MRTTDPISCLNTALQKHACSPPQFALSANSLPPFSCSVRVVLPDGTEHTYAVDKIYKSKKDAKSAVCSLALQQDIIANFENLPGARKRQRTSAPATASEDPISVLTRLANSARCTLTYDFSNSTPFSCHLVIRPMYDTSKILEFQTGQSSFQSKKEAKYAVAQLALDSGALERMLSGSSALPNAPSTSPQSGMLPDEVVALSDPISLITTISQKHLKAPHQMLAFIEVKAESGFAFEVVIRSSNVEQKTYSSQKTYASKKQARREAARHAIAEGILEYIKSIAEPVPQRKTIMTPRERPFLVNPAQSDNAQHAMNVEEAAATVDETLIPSPADAGLFPNFFHDHPVKPISSTKLGVKDGRLIGAEDELEQGSLSLDSSGPLNDTELDVPPAYAEQSGITTYLRAFVEKQLPSAVITCAPIQSDDKFGATLDIRSDNYQADSQVEALYESFAIAQDQVILKLLTTDALQRMELLAQESHDAPTASKLDETVSNTAPTNLVISEDQMTPPNALAMLKLACEQFIGRQTENRARFEVQEVRKGEDESGTCGYIGKLHIPLVPPLNFTTSKPYKSKQEAREAVAEIAMQGKIIAHLKADWLERTSAANKHKSYKGRLQALCSILGLPDPEYTEPTGADGRKNRCIIIAQKKYEMAHTKQAEYESLAKHVYKHLKRESENDVLSTSPV